MEKKGNNSKKGLYSKGKNFPNPVIKIKIVVIQKKSDILSGFFSKAPIEARINAINRIAYPRNFINEGITDASDNDLIFYSDNDEIPKLDDANINTINNKLIFFKQKLFYYKY